ncbi:acetyl/propionyl/methylcrotonyl-CoA carboxylase subunit alpha [Agrobacterium vitis]|uniref:acetyl/propionyl/methylcrotonyl-CoA carboxylase subunit alpha n=1 Tax=Agrobacterium vitis TaxID=373 RepID=UPI0012E97963|nr:acetyl/propionyl/methylcrotonyl-CoA carboxylase subunit alpha [Agrobacterium vitis]MVA42051.1 acetyl-CoA carboxylase biotin carboxylase subunit [Agrobacterium vitis]NSX99307.1 acetyl/propionyl/methylcrotonyl-CoA carboxylase subunit alpha [Agrobacterium vitis]NSZ30446.1 acetyl/propionyl/methylcrotonyl-CoA carboxylase subunit alpha [Agrobacterium vitis]UJL80545.1 acetyl/propionyl/methylcrotonyl-CoA carboxylase subunit alpha [Agrobacterium vitis]UJL85756.1 acetyl/propionyl/methylcrotonyl-CoA c
MFQKILIANRGEIACRIIRTARRMGIATVAVYSQADAGARHVRLADEAILIGPAPARESYLVAENILAAARRTGAEAIHPGYGFLSENEEFAEACAASGIAFIGPPAAAIRAMGSKSAAKELMGKAGVPLVPGYHGTDNDPARLRQEADHIGYPVLIKASAGGGGKGMRRVDRADDFADALASCQREARNAFGDDHVLIEKYILKPRHIEIQVFADSSGNCIHLYERDCSVQRRHQKVLEEAPAPGMTAERRAAMGAAAVTAAKAVGYVGAGTVEFIVNSDGSFYFMEMNTRLQVEHPVTEMVTGLDLVEWQLRVAAGHPLPLRQEDVPLMGHAIEARIYAEDADAGFLPSIGTLQHLGLPQQNAHVRIDSAVDAGDAISPHYDPMIAKLIVYGANRKEALNRMSEALGAIQIVGLTANIGFLHRLIKTPSFAEADLDTGLIEREQERLFALSPVPAGVWYLAALEELLRDVPAKPASPWALTDGWRLTGRAERRIALCCKGETVTVTAVFSGEGWSLALSGTDEPSTFAQGRASQNGPATALDVRIGERRYDAAIMIDGNHRHVFYTGQTFVVERLPDLQRATDTNSGGGGLRAPMPGAIIALLAEPGASLKTGEPLLVMEAMKMEHTIVAPSDGTLASFHFAVGDQVVAGAELVDFQPAA